MSWSTKTRFIRYQGLPMLFYRAALPLSRKTLNYAAGVIRRHRISIGSCWRKLNPGQQALLSPRLPAQRRDIRRSRGRVGVGTTDCLAIRRGDRRASGRQGPEAPQGRPRREEGRVRLRHRRRDRDPHRPGSPRTGPSSPASSLGSTERSKDRDQETFLVGGQEVQAGTGIDNRPDAHLSFLAAVVSSLSSSAEPSASSNAARSTCTSGRSAGSAHAIGRSTGVTPASL